MWDSQYASPTPGWSAKATSSGPLTGPGISEGRALAMEKVSGPLGPRRRIATTLKRLREDSHRNLADVAGALLISTSKLSLAGERPGQTPAPGYPGPDPVLRIEGTPEAARLSRWVTAAQIPGWWTYFDDEVLEQLDTHLAYEADAAVARVYTLPFLPVLLQTDAYAEPHTGHGKRTGADQPAHGDPADPPGGPGQPGGPGSPAAGGRHLRVDTASDGGFSRGNARPADALLERLDPRDGRRPDNIRLHVLPFSARPVRTMTCMYAYFEYQDPEDLEQDVVNIEKHAGWWSIDDPDQVAQYRKWHDGLVSAALDQDESLALIRSVRNSI